MSSNEKKKKNVCEHNFFRTGYSENRKIIIQFVTLFSIISELMTYDNNTN